ncbi:RDD family protein [Comamonas endophytica]
MAAEIAVWWFGPARHPAGDPRRQDAWWLWLGGSPQGPVSAQALEALLHQGKMAQHSLVWKKGLSDWISLAQLADLRKSGALQLEPGLPFDLALAGAWRRFLARMLDLCAISAPIALLGWLLLQQIPGFALWLQRPSAPFQLTLALLPLALLVEAGIFTRFGSTPGKALLGVMVLTPDGQRPTGAQYLRRQWGVFYYGLAMGLPLLSLIAMAAQGLSLQLGEPTPYDLNRFTVRARRLCQTEVRMLVLACIGCTMIGVSYAMAYLGY